MLRWGRSWCLKVGEMEDIGVRYHHISDLSALPSILLSLSGPLVEVGRTVTCWDEGSIFICVWGFGVKVSTGLVGWCCILGAAVHMTSVTFVSDGRNQILVFQEGLFCISKRQRHRKKYLRELTSESNVHKKSDIPLLYQSKIRNLCISGSQENYKAQIILKNCLHHVIGFP